jgi:hypothetical protein
MTTGYIYTNKVPVLPPPGARHESRPREMSDHVIYNSFQCIQFLFPTNQIKMINTDTEYVFYDRVKQAKVHLS